MQKKFLMLIFLLSASLWFISSHVEFFLEGGGPVRRVLLFRSLIVLAFLVPGLYAYIMMKKRQRVEEELRGKERFLENIFASIRDGVCIMDKDLRILRVNRVMEEWYAHAAPLAGKKCHEAFYQRRESCPKCPSLETLKTGEVFRRVVPRPGPGGETIGWQELFAFPLVESETGRPIGVVEYIRDVTERKTYEDDLREKDRFLRSMIESAQDLIFVQDPEGKYLYYHGPSRYGMGVEDMIGKTTEDLFGTGVTGTYLRERVRQVARTGHGLTEETKVKWRGEDLWFLDQLNPVRDEEGKVVAVTTFSRHISELKEAEEKVRRQSATFQGVLESSTSPIFSVDRKYNYTSFNQSHAEVMKNIYGKTIELGKSLLDFMTVEEDRKIAKQNLDRALQGEQFTGESYSGEELLERTYFRVTHNPIREKEGEIAGVAVFVSDITERKRAEEALLAAKEDLERKNKELEAFIYTAAHDLRTPLVSVSGYLHLLARSVVPSFNREQRHIFKRVQANVSHFDRLLKDLLAFSQVGVSEEERDLIPLGILLEKLSQSYESELSRCGAVLKVQPGLPSLHMHPTRARQFFENLLTNSLKFRRPDVLLSVEVGAVEKPESGAPRGHRLFFFRDNGMGIEEKDLPRVFNLFFRARPQETPGTGVGLAIVRKIVEEEKGIIRVESTPAEGTVFTFSLPVAEA